MAGARNHGTILADDLIIKRGADAVKKGIVRRPDLRVIQRCDFFSDVPAGVGGNRNGSSAGPHELASRAKNLLSQIPVSPAVKDPGKLQLPRP